MEKEKAKKLQDKIKSLPDGKLKDSLKKDLDQFKEMVEYIRESEKAKGTTTKKMTRGEILQREVLGKSIVCSCDIKKDDIFSEENIEVKSPARGLSPQYYYELLGKKSSREIKNGEYLQLDDLE